MLRVSLLIAGVVLVVVGCGKPPESAPAPRTVKVFTVGQSVESDPSADAVTMPSVIARDPAALAFDAGGRVMAVMVAVVVAVMVVAEQDVRLVDVGYAVAALKPAYALNVAELPASVSRWPVPPPPRC